MTKPLYGTLDGPLANFGIWPQWRSQSAFKARRDAPANERK